VKDTGQYLSCHDERPQRLYWRVSVSSVNQTRDGQRSKRPKPFRLIERILSDSTLSRQRENIAGLEVVLVLTLACDLGRMKNHGLKSARLQGLAAAESGFKVVPPFEFIALIGLPTEKDDTAVPHRREID